MHPYTVYMYYGSPSNTIINQSNKLYALKNYHYNLSMILNIFQNAKDSLLK